MKTNISLVCLGLILSAATVFGQGRQTRTIDTFTKLSFRVPGKLYLRQGSPQKIELEGDKETLDKIETEVSGGKLSVQIEKKWSNKNWHNEGQIKIYVTVKDIESIDVSGSGDLIAETKLTAGDFDLSVSGSGSLQAEIELTGGMNADVSGSGGIDLKGKFKNFKSDVSGSGGITLAATITEGADFELSGSGKIHASGTAQSVNASISGSGKVLAANLETDKCTVRIAGSGDVEINVKSDLDASISGSGSVSYKGNPAHVNSHASGSGHISKM